MQFFQTNSLRLKFRQAFLIPAFVVCIFLTSALPAKASNALRYMPEDALGFALIRNLEVVDEKVSRFTKLFGLNYPSPLTFAKFATGLDEGIRQQGDMLIALLPGMRSTSEPQAMVLLPVDDYTKFATSIHGDASGEICRVAIAGEGVLVAKFGEYALLMDVEHRETMSLMLGLQQSPVKSLKPLDSWIEQNDVVIAIMPAGMKQLLKLGSQIVAQQQALLDDDLDDPEFNHLLEQLKLSSGMLKFMLRIIDSQVELAAVAISLDQQTNLRISKRVLFKQGSKFEAASQIKIEQTSPLLGYIDQPFVVAGGGPLPKEWANVAVGISRVLIKNMQSAIGFEGLEEAQWQNLQDAYLSLMNGLGSVSMIFLPGEEGDPLSSNSYTVFTSADAEQYLKTYEKAVEVWNEFMESSTSDLRLKYEIIPRTIVTKKACEIVVDSISATQAAFIPAFKNMLEAMFGEEGKMRALLVAASQKTLVFSTSNEEKVVSFLKHVEDKETGLRDSDEIQTAMKLMPADAPWKLFVSPKGSVAWGKRFIEAYASSLLGQVPEIPDFDSSPPVGFSFNITDGRAETDAAIPVETLKALASYIEKIK